LTSVPAADHPLSQPQKKKKKITDGKVLEKIEVAHESLTLFDSIPNIFSIERLLLVPCEKEEEKETYHI